MGLSNAKWTELVIFDLLFYDALLWVNIYTVVLIQGRRLESEPADKIDNIKTKKIEGMDIPYLQLNYTDGTVCELIGMPRQINVLYMCTDHTKHDLYSIKEISTCHYEAIIFTPLLCTHPLYKWVNSIF